MMSINNLMLVDDDDIYVYLTKKVINESKLARKVKVFENGKQAIDFLEMVAEYEELLPEIIFLDIAMPILDGWGFLEEYIEIQPTFKKKVTLYLVSSSISPHDLERAHGISVVSDFIVKPITKEKLIDIVNNL